MSDPRSILRKKFDEKNRFANFGNVLTQMEIRGFRGHKHTLIEFKSPITAISGPNGAGKSTILELAACAYDIPDGSNFNISSFFAISRLDPAPFTRDARVRFTHWEKDYTPDKRPAPITISRRSSGWDGYKVRKSRQRKVFFPRIQLHTPRAMRRDFVFRQSEKLQITQSRKARKTTLDWCNRLLSRNYAAVNEHTVSYKKSSTSIMSSQYMDCVYSEHHMGHGEGLLQTLVHQLEAWPEKSLILLEEPETALHQKAQHKLGHYLMDLCIRKGHQILLTTHSNFLLEGLPRESAVYLEPRPKGGISVLPETTPNQVLSMLSGGHPRQLSIIVEDDCAKIVLSCILRKADRHFAESIEIYPAGITMEDGSKQASGAQEIKTAMKMLARTGVPVCAVLDGDQQPNTEYFIFTLPGDQAPEHELLHNYEVKEYFSTRFDIDIDDFLADCSDMDHHKHFSELARRLNQHEQALVSEAARIYTENMDPSLYNTLVVLLKDAALRTKKKSRR